MPDGQPATPYGSFGGSSTGCSAGWACDGVAALEPPHLLRLRAEMKLPGTAWLQFEVLPDVDGARIEQTAFFDPHGLLGYLYWYAFLPFHRFIFPGLIRAVRRSAQTGIPELPAA